MPQETDRLKLPLPLGNETVTRESINGIFEKIDRGVATQADLDTLREAVSQMDIPDASLTQKGKVQLSSKTDGTSETVAATEKAVRDARVAAETNAKNSSLPIAGGDVGSGLAGPLNLVSTPTTNHVYMGYYPEGKTAGRKAYIGFGSGTAPAASDFTISNERGGNIIFRDVNGVTSVADLKQSVSNGKASIAAAITGKGVPTAADAQFATMASNVAKIQQGRYQNLNITNSQSDVTIGTSYEGTKWTSFAKFPAGTKLITMITGSINFGNSYTPTRVNQYAASMDICLFDTNANRISLLSISGGNINNDNYSWYNFDIGATLTSLFLDSTRKNVGCSGSIKYVSYQNGNSTRNKPYTAINIPPGFNVDGELELALYITKSNITDGAWAGGQGTGIHYYSSSTTIVSV
ncbi:MULTISPECIES: tail fiber protein [Paenibacillus]|uniref:Tail fiber protein n=1 Tax=Paenibacillus xylanilyticus TaxID=248903 RepID=A0A7Y6EYA5_9BACL|nr:phage tail protein [Paenibacillus xylanilyticus]NUU78534.1 tail fiber protein [Paenibacillus xylanilyticus]